MKKIIFFFFFVWFRLIFVVFSLEQLNKRKIKLCVHEAEDLVQHMISNEHDAQFECLWGDNFDQTSNRPPDTHFLYVTINKLQKKFIE
ncbi:hypothetical protein BpHYR1_054602 [Brachionus plicatilis]|uniref:Secreted protein n=1 Tax=Brachionus plicatilis TaxID=10195 RepID=A0A3M7RGA5_BRAPC|nr:hypothetical protein BpHYR1_054602 [Brachionus plicatilis]